MGAPRIAAWKSPGTWPKLIRDPYAAPSPSVAPMREIDEEGGCRLLYRGEEVLALSGGIALDNGRTSVLGYFILADGQKKSFVVRGGEDEVMWLRDSLSPEARR